MGDYFVVVGNVSTVNLTKCMINCYHYIGISSLRLIINNTVYSTGEALPES